MCSRTRQYTQYMSPYMPCLLRGSRWKEHLPPVCSVLPDAARNDQVAALVALTGSNKATVTSGDTPLGGAAILAIPQAQLVVALDL